MEDRRAHVDLALMLTVSSSSFYTLPPTIDVRQALLQLTQHVLELMVGIHAYRHLTPHLAKGRGESGVISIHVKPLRENEGLVAVDLC